jgi:hypothetical protein
LIWSFIISTTYKAFAGEIEKIAWQNHDLFTTLCYFVSPLYVGFIEELK